MNEINIKVEKKPDGSFSGEGNVKAPAHVIGLTILTLGVVTVVIALTVWLMR